MRVMSFFAFLSAIICFAINSHAHDHEHRELKAHVHGKAKLDISIEGNRIEADLDIPGMDFVGFEGKAKNDKQKKNLEKIKKMFEKDYNMFLITEEAGCVVKARKLDVDDEKEHTEYEYTIEYQCKDVSKVKELDVNLFRDIETLKEVNVELVTETIQKELKIYPTKSKIQI